MYEIFEKLRKERGVSVYKISKDTGISQAALSAWKKRGGYMNASNCQILADYFGIDVSIFTRKDASAAINPEDYKLTKEALEVALAYDRADEQTKGMIHRLLTYIRQYDQN